MALYTALAQKFVKILVEVFSRHYRYMVAPKPFPSLMLNDYEVVNFLVYRNSYLLKIKAKNVFTKDISKEQIGEKTSSKQFTTVPQCGKMKNLVSPKNISSN